MKRLALALALISSTVMLSGCIIVPHHHHGRHHHYDARPYGGGPVFVEPGPRR
ncbi:hypothetical protein ACG04Q_16035 [Roseateles sp. DXS20W]|uniref:Lipoprotein n=1 Tax=Pelomonas lactea TaxID=3299030 RepID=A0ABW7GMA6_9BURK